MTINIQPITLTGKLLLESELKNLIEVERPLVITSIEVARGHGDLSENADYSAAKEKQAHIEGRIATISTTLGNSDVVDTSKINSTKITFGAFVHLEEKQAGKKIYQIVGVDESNINKGKLSVNSPLARSLIGLSKGDEFEFHSPAGQEKFYHILDFYFK